MFFILLSSQATALIDYHIFCRLSTTFLFFLFRFCNFINHFQATAYLLYHIRQPFVKNFFSSFFFAFFILHFPYPARAVQCFQFCISCLSDEDYLIISFLNCQRFSCFLFISHNSDNSLCLLILYTKYLFSTSTYTKHIIILKNYYYSQYSSRTSVRLGA